MVIDSHEHLILPVEKQLGKMNEAGVDRAILFSTLPHPENAENLSTMNSEMSKLYKILNGKNTIEENIKRMNHGISELKERISEYPDYFLGFAPIPLGLNYFDTNEWIENKVIKNGFLGIGEFTPGNDEQISNLRIIFESVHEHNNLPIWIHTFNPVTLQGIKILIELCSEFPDVKVIFGHLGGSNWMNVIEFAKNHQNAYLDLSAAFTSIATKIAVNEIPERCLYSSDAPYGEPILYRQLIEYVCPSNQIAEMVLGGNISRLLSL